MNTPIEQVMIETVKWDVVPRPADFKDDSIPYATHSGEFEALGVKLRCYRLSDGKAVFHADDFNKLMELICPIEKRRRRAAREAPLTN